MNEGGLIMVNLVTIEIRDTEIRQRVMMLLNACTKIKNRIGTIENQNHFSLKRFSIDVDFLPPFLAIILVGVLCF